MSIAARNAILAGGAALPYDAEVEYLISDGYSYFDSGIKANSIYDFSVTFFVNKAHYSGYPQLFSIDGDKFSIGFLSYMQTNNIYYRNKGNEIFGGSVASGIVCYVEAGSKYTVYTKNNRAYVNGSVVGKRVGYPQSPYATNVFILAKTGGTNIAEDIPFYEGIFYDALHNEIAHYIPVRRGRIGCLFDTVSQTILENQGTGAFIIGPDKA